MVEHDDSQLIPLGVMAAILGISARDLRVEANAGRLPHVRVGDKGLLFDRQRVEGCLVGRAREDASSNSSSPDSREEVRDED